MAIVLALLSALGYGVSDFSAGLASRRYAPEPVTGLTVAIEVLTALVGVAVFPGHGSSGHSLAWGAVSGLGDGLGALALYRGFSAGRMTIVATVSGVLAAVLPAVVGVALGDHLALLSATGIVIAIPAIALVCWQPGEADRAGAPSGFGYGLLAGVGFALLFVGLDRAGTRAGAWPLLPAQLVGLLVVLPSALSRVRSAGAPRRLDALLIVAAGGLGGAAALVFLAATGYGALSIVAVIAALYPAFTVLLARGVLHERWTRSQTIGLLSAAASVVLVSVS